MSRSGKRHVAIVGGGVVGCAVAYQLARSGLRITLLERDAIAAHASSRNAGNLNPLFGTTPALIPFTLECFRLHQIVRAELELRGFLRHPALPVKRVLLGIKEEDRAHFTQVSRLFNATPGFSASEMDRNDLQRIEPRLAPTPNFGLLTEGSLTVDGKEFTCALAQAAENLGATIQRHLVQGIATSGDRVTEVRTNQGSLACDDIVFATGPWVAAVNSWLGINIAVEPVKGQILLMRMSGAVPQYDFTLGASALYRRHENEVWVGGTWEKCGFDAAPSDEARQSLIEGAAQILPCIRDAELLDHVAALRPMPASGAPIAARADRWQNVYIANGGGMKGVLLSVGIANRICNILLDRHNCSQLHESISHE